MAKKILVIGCNGQLGQDMVLTFQSLDHQVLGLDFPEIDITQAAKLEEALNETHPDLVINCAAYTAVDACEENREKAYAANATGAGNLAIATKRIGASIVHISTDYVFDGSKAGAYVETDTPNPQSVYGQSKLEGERLVVSGNPKHFVLRIAWLYGNRGNNFAKTIRQVATRKAEEKSSMKVVDDQIGSPTYTMEVCRQAVTLFEAEKFGLYHATAEGQCSWYDFAREIIASYGINVELLPCTTDEFPRAAPRPANSVLENQRLKQGGLNVMKPWQEAFKEYLQEQRQIAPQ